MLSCAWQDGAAHDTQGGARGADERAPADGDRAARGDEAAEHVEGGVRPADRDGPGEAGQPRAVHQAADRAAKVGPQQQPIRNPSAVRK
eukprot:scaffold14520_cov63-Phaeocystis_antarctica.AAC.4